MPPFRYQATTSSRKNVSGVVEAETAAEAQRRLEERGLIAISVQPAVLIKPRAATAPPPRRSVWPWVVAGVVALATAVALAYVRQRR